MKHAHTLTLIAVLVFLAVTAQGQTNVVETGAGGGAGGSGPAAGGGAGQTNENTIVALLLENIATNICFSTNWCNRIPASEITNAVNDLAASGDICRRFGHCWRFGKRVSEQDKKAHCEYLYDLEGIWLTRDDIGATYRTCRICGKEFIQAAAAVPARWNTKRKENGNETQR